MEELHILTHTELQILASLSGMEELYGIKPAEEEKLDETTAMYAMHEMVQKNIFSQMDDSLVLNESYKKILDVLKEPNVILNLSYTSADKSDFCLYFGKQVIYMEESPNDVNSVRIGIYQKEDLARLFGENDILPEPYVDKDVASMQPLEEMLERLNESVKTEINNPDCINLLAQDGVPETGSVYLQVLFIHPKESKEAQCALYLIEDPFNPWIVQKQNGISAYEQYDREAMVHKILDMLDM